MAVVERPLAWRDPLGVAAGLAHRDGALALLSDGGPRGASVPPEPWGEESRARSSGD